MAAVPIIRTCSAALALVLSAPAWAQGDPAAYVRARAADAAGSAQAAAQGYARALAAAPDDQIVAMRAYRQALTVGDYSLASRAAAVMVRAGMAPPDTAILAFAIAVHARNLAGANAAVDRIASGPLDFLAPGLRGWLAYDRGEDAVAQLDQAKGSALARRYTERHRALLLIASGRSSEAVVALAPSLTAEPDTDLRIDAAMLLAGSGKRDPARALLAGTDQSLRQLGKARASAAFGGSRLFVQLAGDIAGEDMQALSILLGRAALLLDPEEDRARLLLAEALSQDGAADLALGLLGEIGRDSPVAREAGAARIGVLQRAGQGEAAAVAARALAEGKGASRDGAELYGALLGDLGRNDEAAAAYGRALGLAGEAGSWKLHYLQGRAYDRAGNWAAALPALRRAVALAPDEAAPLRYLGYALVLRGEALEEAQQLLERASKLRPEDADISNSLAWAYYRRGDVARALPLLERAAKADPGGAQVNEHLGDAYWRLGRRYEARYAWRAAAIGAEGDATARIAGKLAGGLQSN
ncbi:tetratricopeptide repeat protein [Sphingomonas sp. MMS12-HWE2-04]|uniref:tetratricopeptide repeat protein n=1 Tax=Sphingomonas sp. MMS12-HWE2-04 TaxID=3234199 RepID=UPI00385159C8